MVLNHFAVKLLNVVGNFGKFCKSGSADDAVLVVCKANVIAQKHTMPGMYCDVQ